MLTKLDVRKWKFARFKLLATKSYGIYTVIVGYTIREYCEKLLNQNCTCNTSYTAQKIKFPVTGHVQEMYRIDYIFRAVLAIGTWLILHWD